MRGFFFFLEFYALAVDDFRENMNSLYRISNVIKNMVDEQKVIQFWKTIAIIFYLSYCFWIKHHYWDSRGIFLFKWPTSFKSQPNEFKFGCGCLKTVLKAKLPRRVILKEQDA